MKQSKSFRAVKLDVSRLEALNAELLSQNVRASNDARHGLSVFAAGPAGFYPGDIITHTQTTGFINPGLFGDDCAPSHVLLGIMHTATPFTHDLIELCSKIDMRAVTAVFDYTASTSNLVNVLSDNALAFDAVFKGSAVSVRNHLHWSPHRPVIPKALAEMPETSDGMMDDGKDGEAAPTKLPEFTDRELADVALSNLESGGYKQQALTLCPIVALMSATSALGSFGDKVNCLSFGLINSSPEVPPGTVDVFTVACARINKDERIIMAPYLSGEADTGFAHLTATSVEEALQAAQKSVLLTALPKSDFSPYRGAPWPFNAVRWQPDKTAVMSALDEFAIQLAAVLTGISMPRDAYEAGYGDVRKSARLLDQLLSAHALAPFNWDDICRVPDVYASKHLSKLPAIRRALAKISAENTTEEEFERYIQSRDRSKQLAEFDHPTHRPPMHAVLHKIYDQMCSAMRTALGILALTEEQLQDLRAEVKPSSRWHSRSVRGNDTTGVSEQKGGDEPDKAPSKSKEGVVAVAFLHPEAFSAFLVTTAGTLLECTSLSDWEIMAMSPRFPADSGTI